MEADDVAGVARAWAQAIVANDAELIASFMADDWVIVSPTGVTSREQFLSSVASGALTHSAMDAVTAPRIRVYGDDTAVFTARVTNTAHFAGQTFESDEWTTDVFRRQGGRWRCVLSHITPAEPAGT